MLPLSNADYALCRSRRHRRGGSSPRDRRGCTRSGSDQLLRSRASSTLLVTYSNAPVFLVTGSLAAMLTPAAQWSGAPNDADALRRLGPPSGIQACSGRGSLVNPVSPSPASGHDRLCWHQRSPLDLRGGCGPPTKHTPLRESAPRSTPHFAINGLDRHTSDGVPQGERSTATFPTRGSCRMAVDRLPRTGDRKIDRRGARLLAERWEPTAEAAPGTEFRDNM
jgi:hypothetical protein